MRWWPATTLLVGVELVGCTRKEQPTVSVLVRKIMVNILQLLPNDSEMTSNYRRKSGWALN